MVVDMTETWVFLLLMKNDLTPYKTPSKERFTGLNEFEVQGSNALLIPR